MDPNDIVKEECFDTIENYVGVFMNNMLEPEVLIKTEVFDEDLGPTDKNETVFRLPTSKEMDPNYIVKKENCDTREDYVGVFMKKKLEPEVLVKKEVTNEDLGPENGNETAFIDYSYGS